MKNKLTLEDVESVIREESYTKLGSKTTVCLMILRNGFEITGTSACVDPSTFNEEIGNKVARENCIQLIWQLEGYLLQEKLATS